MRLTPFTFRIITLIFFCCITTNLSGQFYEQNHIGIGNAPFDHHLGVQILSAQVGDADANGQPDLFITTYEGLYFWVINYQTENPRIETFDLPSFSGVIVLDVNGDKISDLLVSNFSGDCYYEGKGFLKYNIHHISNERSFLPTSHFHIKRNEKLEIAVHSSAKISSNGSRTHYFEAENDKLVRKYSRYANRGFIEDYDLDGQSDFINVKKQVPSYFDKDGIIHSIELPESIPKFEEIYFKDFDKDMDIDIFYKASDEFFILEKSEDQYISHDLGIKKGIDNFTFTDIDLDGELELSIVSRDGTLYTIKDDLTVAEEQFPASVPASAYTTQQYFDGQHENLFIQVNENVVSYKYLGLPQHHIVLPIFPERYHGLFFDVDEDGIDEIFANDRIYKKNGQNHYAEVSLDIFGDINGTLLSVDNITNDGLPDYTFQDDNKLVVFLSNGNEYRRLETLTFGKINFLSVADLDGDGDKDYVISQESSGSNNVTISLIRNNNNESLSTNLIIEESESNKYYTKYRYLDKNWLKEAPYILTDINGDGTYDLRCLPRYQNGQQLNYFSVKHYDLLRPDYTRQKNGISVFDIKKKDYYLQLNSDKYLDWIDFHREENELEITIDGESEQSKILNLTDYHIDHFNVESISEPNANGERKIMLAISQGFVIYTLDSNFNIIDFEKPSLDFGSSFPEDEVYRLIDIDHDKDWDIISNTINVPNAMIWYENKNEAPHSYIAPFYDGNGNNVMDGQDYLIKNLAFDTEPVAKFTRTNGLGYINLFFEPNTDSTTLSFNSSLWQPSDNDILPMTVPIRGDTTQIGMQPIGAQKNIKTIFNIPSLRCASKVIGYCTIVNRGNVVLEGTYKLEVDASLDILDPDLPFDNMEIVDDKKIFSWNEIFLVPGEKEVIQVELYIPGIEEFDLTFPNFKFTGTFQSEEIEFIDSYKSKLKCAYDPNDKLVNPARDRGAVIPEEQLLYTIRFQNTGNDFAKDVVIIDTLDHALASESIDIVSTSHPEVFSYSINDNIAAFRFEDIYLPDSSMNQSLSNGYVSFTINQKYNLPIGQEIYNDAAIFFDSNPPIYTNTTKSVVFEEATKTAEPISILDFEIYPNPNSGVINIKSKEVIKSFSIYSTQGELLLTRNYSPNTKLSSYLNGLYIVEVTSENGKRGRKPIFIKQE